MPKDCGTSDWSPWSACSKTCRASDLSPGYRFRTRSRIQAPIGGGKECPGLEEKEACNIIGDLLPHCPRYVWKNTDWGECRVAPLLSQQDRRLNNIMSRPVNRKLCAGDTPVAVQPCSIPCPKQCSLSPWSSWGACLHDNCMEPQGRKGFRQRRRQVLSEAAGGSDGCPHLLESMPCEDPVCFQWHVLSEDACAITTTTATTAPTAATTITVTATQGACGSGTANQTVVCISAEGTPASLTRIYFSSMLGKCSAKGPVQGLQSAREAGTACP
ncbi:hypothetical protein ACEWY4_023349 [Coilia grayii]|uniref:Spondin-like TSP1 domain-containing protein n=1 Tax=Coilia grayii TaxID=363190 RepID=A0ABD1J4D8_9TELE